MRRQIALILCLAMLFGLCGSTFADGGVAEQKQLHVALGDSVPWGDIDDAGSTEMTYPRLVADHYGADFIQLARVGLMTSDIMYILDADYERSVRSGEIPIKAWNMEFYDESVEAIAAMRQAVIDADVLSLFIGVNDIQTYPGSIYDADKESRLTLDEYLDELRELAGNGKYDFGVISRLVKLMYVAAVEGNSLATYVLNMVKGFFKYLDNYPKLIAKMRELNPDATIVCPGLYLARQEWSVLYLAEERFPELQELLWKLTDMLNTNIKDTALKYNCLYVRSFGIENKRHPTMTGHAQLAERIIAAIDGNVQFADAELGFWAYESIKSCFENGIMNGVGSGLFDPERALTRAELVTVLYRLAGEPPVEGLTEPFEDVAEGDPAYDAIVWAYNKGITLGVEDGLFAPDMTATREQLITMLWRFAGESMSGASLRCFTDAGSVSDWARPAMEWAVGAGIIKGMGDNILSPLSAASRAQCAAIADRFMNIA